MLAGARSKGEEKYLQTKNKKTRNQAEEQRSLWHFPPPGGPPEKKIRVCTGGGGKTRPCPNHSGRCQDHSETKFKSPEKGKEINIRNNVPAGVSASSGPLPWYEKFTRVGAEI